MFVCLHFLIKFGHILIRQRGKSLWSVSYLVSYFLSPHPKPTSQFSSWKLSLWKLDEKGLRKKMFKGGERNKEKCSSDPNSQPNYIPFLSMQHICRETGEWNSLVSKLLRFVRTNISSDLSLRFFVFVFVTLNTT